MEIIKKGKTVRRYLCECECEFEAASIDRKVEHDYFKHTSRYYVICPECGRKNVIMFIKENEND